MNMVYFIWDISKQLIDLTVEQKVIDNVYFIIKIIKQFYGLEK